MAKIGKIRWCKDRMSSIIAALSYYGTWKGIYTITVKIKTDHLQFLFPVVDRKKSTEGILYGIQNRISDFINRSLDGHEIKLGVFTCKNNLFKTVSDFSFAWFIFFKLNRKLQYC